jgi:predicted amidophosphoribosyltransferase
LPQKKLTPEERLKNLQQAFAVRPPMGRGEVIPETVVLVDDIYTTGSTMEACTRVLKAAGVKKVYFLTICIGYG